MKKLFGLILFFAALASASMIGVDALGEEQIASGSAGAAGRGFAGGAKTGEAEGFVVTNPARIAFDTKVVFNLNFLMDLYSAESHGKSYFTETLSLPSFNLSFPMGDFGALGLSLWQSYSTSLLEDVKDSVSNADAKIEYQGSVYEIIPSYAVRLPFFRGVSLGFSVHIVLGSNNVRKLDVNHLSLDQLKKHPYLNFYQARALVEARRLHGPLHSAADLRLLPDFSEKDIKRLIPYLKF